MHFVAQSDDMISVACADRPSRMVGAQPRTVATACAHRHAGCRRRPLHGTGSDCIAVDACARAGVRFRAHHYRHRRGDDARYVGSPGRSLSATAGHRPGGVDVDHVGGHPHARDAHQCRGDARHPDNHDDARAAACRDHTQKSGETAFDRRSLWRFGISGDRPIIVVEAAAVRGIGLVRSLVRALRLWSWGGVACDLSCSTAEPSPIRCRCSSSCPRSANNMRTRHGVVGTVRTASACIHADEVIDGGAHGADRAARGCGCTPTGDRCRITYRNSWNGTTTHCADAWNRRTARSRRPTAHVGGHGGCEASSTVPEVSDFGEASAASRAAVDQRARQSDCSARRSPRRAPVIRGPATAGCTS